MAGIRIPKVVTSYIGGAWTSVDKQADVIPVINPACEEPVSTLQEASVAEVDAAVTAARETFDGGRWADTSIEDRKAVLLRIRDLICDNAEELAHLEVLNTGIPIQQVVARHVPRAAVNFEFFAEFISTADARSYDQDPNYHTYVRNEPAGTVSLIAPWNAPLALATMNLAGAIAFGNSCVLKPSEFTPLAFVPLMDLLKEAGVPDGVVNMVNGRGAECGAALVDHPEVDVVAFTGGTETGKEIGAAAGRGLKKVVTELGGKSANIIFADADFDRALDAALISIFSNNGQQCLAGSRILVQRSIGDRFREAFLARVAKLRVGDPMDEHTEIGPLISEAQLERISHFADLAANTEGLEVLQGGQRHNDTDSGYYFEPTVIAANNNSHPHCQEEIFGPFATILTFDDFDEAMAIANDSRFGLVSYVWSQNISRIMAAVKALRTGIVWANTPMTRELRAPFGGFKHSGVGRMGGEWSRSLFTEEKTVTIAARDFPLAKLGK